MDKKYIERPERFNKQEYTGNYNKQHYKDFGVKVSPEIVERIKEYCTRNKISKADFVRIAIDTLEELER